jgi:hypothetical protein
MNEVMEIQPISYLRKVVAGWKLVLSFSIFFAIFGVALSTFLKPVYQASTLLQADIDYQRAAPLDDVTVMKAYEKVRGVLLADDVLETAIQTTAEGPAGAGEFTDIAAMRDRIRVIQRPEGWELIVYSNRPGRAALLANAWADNALLQLEEGLRHSLKAWEWQGALYSAHCVLGLDPNDPSRTVWTCSTRSEGLDPDEIPEAILEEVRQSRGILPMFSFSILQHASIPATAILWRRSTIILAAALLGAAAGMSWVIGCSEK